MAVPRPRQTRKVRQIAAGNGMEDQRVDRESLYRATGRSLRFGTGSEVHLDKTARRGWPDTGVGTGIGALWPAGFQAQEFARRIRRGLAHHLRGFGAVLRQS